MNQQKIMIIAIIVLVCFVLSGVIKHYLNKKYTLKLMNAMADDEETFNQLVDSTMIKLLFEPFNREYLRLNYYIAHDNAIKIKNQIDLLDKMRTNKAQQQAYMNLAFQYYIMGRKEKEAKKMGKRLIAFIQANGADNEDLIIEDINMNLAIFIDHDQSLIPTMGEKIEQTEKDEKATWLFRRAYLYKHNNQPELAKQDLEEALNHVTNDGQKEVIHKILEEGLDVL